MSKYGAKKTEVDGIRFDSKAEAKYYQELKLMKVTKEILHFDLQPEFLIHDSFVDFSGKKQRAIKYKADFMVYHINGKKEVIDVKGFRTAEYKLKRKMFMSRYPQYTFTEVQA